MTIKEKSAILFLALIGVQNGGIAQLARARGSYPRCHWFKSSCRYHYKKRTGVRFHIKRPGGQAVKTPPFHGGNTGSSPVRVTNRFIWRHSSAGRALASHARGHRFEFCCLHQKDKIRTFSQSGIGSDLFIIWTKSPYKPAFPVLIA